LILHLMVDGSRLDFPVNKILNAGYTARGRGEVEKHIEEMRKEGIATPSSVPVFFPKIADRITTGEKVAVLTGDTTSAEAEFVLLFADRKLEQHSILAAKQVCASVISAAVWRYEEVKEHWDDLILRSWVEKDGQRQLYQQARLGTFMEVAELIDRVKEQVDGDLGGLVFYGGTIPIIGGEMCFSPRFEAELLDERRGRSLSCAYSVVPITWFRGEMQLA